MYRFEGNIQVMQSIIYVVLVGRGQQLGVQLLIPGVFSF